MRTLYKLCFFLILMPTLLLASNETPKAAKHEKQKTLKKSFNVNADATFNITSRYGNIDIITWDKNRIDVQVTIKVNGNNENKVNERLNELDVAWQSAPHKVSAISSIGGNSYDTSWWNKKLGNNVKIEINYLVKMPITNNLKIFNDYGYINLDKLEGNAYLKCDYGKVTTKELMGRSNTIRLDYTKNSYFEFINNGTIEADYSEFTVAKVKDLNLEADYTTSIIEIAENVVYECDYGSLKIDNINNLDGEGDYLALRLGTIFKTAHISSDYGSIKIDRLVSKTKTIDINSEFTGITIGFDTDCKFNFNIGIEFGSFREPEGFIYKEKNVNNIGKQFIGYYGEQNSENLVLINSEYGSITFKNN
ncbi:hypothetical protein [Winogradskyella psychrotolerans]|uniref:hypothetical protein n=1 Tax=Winogradskyella psychrotolerans TaxID=1344585 RepID=UPI001C067963|nr:hypothetical protein [Winogradskyella psychrotolerans]MBU2930007.1 hypothetical protein [Winogradskyella psychrotolerans]